MVGEVPQGPSAQFPVHPISDLYDEIKVAFTQFLLEARVEPAKAACGGVSKKESLQAKAAAITTAAKIVCLKYFFILFISFKIKFLLSKES